MTRRDLLGILIIAALIAALVAALLSAHHYTSPMHGYPPTPSFQPHPMKVAGPLLVVPDFSGVEPTWLVFSGNTVWGIHWTVWNQTEAQGTGQSTSGVPATIRLTAVHDGKFTALSETRAGVLTLGWPLAGG